MNYKREARTKVIALTKNQIEDIIVYLNCLDYLLEKKDLKNSKLKLVIDYLSEQYKNA